MNDAISRAATFLDIVMANAQPLTYADLSVELSTHSNIVSRASVKIQNPCGFNSQFTQNCINTAKDTGGVIQFRPRGDIYVVYTAK